MLFVQRRLPQWRQAATNIQRHANPEWNHAVLPASGSDHPSSPNGLWRSLTAHQCLDLCLHIGYLDKLAKQWYSPANVPPLNCQINHYWENITMWLEIQGERLSRLSFLGSIRTSMQSRIPQAGADDPCPLPKKPYTEMRVFFPGHRACPAPYPISW